MKHLCIFCRKRAESREHAGENWLLTFLFGEDQDMTLEFVRGATMERVPIPEGEALKVMCLCERCNTQWINNLGTRAQACIKSLATDKPFTITEGVRRDLATWILVRAMIYDCLHGQEPFYTHDERAYVMEHLSPPLNTYVWLGRFDVGGELHTAFYEVPLIPGPEMPAAIPKVECHASTITVGHLVLQCLSLRPEPNSGDIDIGIRAKNVKGAEGIRCFWPRLPAGVSLTWPPPASFVGHAALAAFEHRFRGTP